MYPHDSQHSLAIDHAILDYMLAFRPPTIDKNKTYQYINSYYYYSEAWQFQPGIRIEGPLLTCEVTGGLYHGARYRTSFDADFPHFEVSNNNASDFKPESLGVRSLGLDSRNSS